MAGEIANLSDNICDSGTETEFTLEELEKILEEEVCQSLNDLEFLEEEKNTINSPEKLGDIVGNVIWDQLMTQIAVTAGEDFIAENRGFTLDLRKAAHIQTTENFNIDPKKAKIASHNEYIDYQKRYDEWQSNFQRDENGNIKTHKIRTGEEVPTLVKGAREYFDEKRPTGSKERKTDMDHIIPAAEFIRDPASNAHLTREEQEHFANSKINLYEMDSSLNKSKSDMATDVWLDYPNARGQKPKDIFPISDELETELREVNNNARENKNKLIEYGEMRSVETGKRSRRRETWRIGKKVLRTVLIQMLADLLRTIIGKLIRWFKEKERKLETLVADIKTATISFITDVKRHVVNISQAAITTILSSIIGPVVGTLRKVWIMLKQGWASLKEAVNFLRKPENRNKPIGYLLLEAGKIVIAGLAGIGAIVLSDVIEKGLDTIPVFAVEIPLLGSLANILGIFFGAVVSGIIGAIAINFIEKKISKIRKEEITKKQLQKQNELINLQTVRNDVSKKIFDEHKATAIVNIGNNHTAASATMSDTIETIKSNLAVNDSFQKSLAEMECLADQLSGGN